MYMSKISLNSRRRGGMKLLGNRHAMHAAVMSAFAPGAETATGEGRVLWRIDRHRDSVDLLIVSPAKPCLAHINEQAGWSTGSTWATRDYTPFLSSLTDGGEFAFRLTANPTHRATVHDGDGENTKQRIVGHVTNGHQREWFAGRTEPNGFSLVPSLTEEGQEPRPELILRDRETAVFSRQGKRITLVTAAFEGRLRITDADRMRHALTHGIGRAKGYGCGLMTLLPVG